MIKIKMNFSQSKRIIKEYPQARDYMDWVDDCREAHKVHGFESSADVCHHIATLFTGGNP
jgi:hypothetical protein